ILSDAKKSEGTARDEAMRRNRAAFKRMATAKEQDKPRILLKVVGELDHGGEEVLKPDSAEYRVLAEFVRQVNGVVPATVPAALDPRPPPSSAGVALPDDGRLLRRVPLSLAGRFPTDAELAAVARSGLQAMPALLDAIMKEEAFYDRLREGFNDIFLTLG